MIKLSVVMATYNAKDSVEQAILSIEGTVRKDEIEIIAVDDCSNDTTCDVIKNLQKNYSNIKLYKMKKNSGSPSEPRNFGIEKASGKYITFVDDDDTVNADNLMDMLDVISEKEADFGKGYLINFDGKNKTVENRIGIECKDSFDTMEKLIQYQSTTSDLIVRRKFLTQNKIRYNSDLKIGEDTVFVADIFSHNPNTIYIDNYFLYYNKISEKISNLSSTQNCGDREIYNQITSWRTTRKVLSEISIDYYGLRLPASFRNILISIVRYSNGISEECFRGLSNFAKETEVYTKGTMSLAERYNDLYKSLLSGNYDEFLRQSRRRILINGYDLKFIIPVVPYLEKFYDVRIDEWTGHDTHDKKKSKELLEWADIIWCEWLLGNAVYYSQRKNKNQRLIIRCHRFELDRDFGNKINLDNVNMILTVGYYYFEGFAERFKFPKEKMRLLSNYVETRIYSKEKSAESKYNIGLIGILPRRKGFFRGLELLKILKNENSKFKFYVMGKSYKEIDWIKNNPEEWEYFKKCDDFIKNNGLTDSVIYGGFIERENLYNDIGYVLSLSDNEKPESFHLAPAEGVCSGSIGMLLNWPGAEYIYSEDFIFENIEEMSKFILNVSNNETLFNEVLKKQKDYIISNYNIDGFMEELLTYLKETMIMS